MEFEPCKLCHDRNKSFILANNKSKFEEDKQSKEVNLAKNNKIAKNVPKRNNYKFKKFFFGADVKKYELQQNPVNRQ